MANITNNYLTLLRDAGSDAFKNLFLVKFTGGFFADNDDSYTIRCKDFSMPAISQETYTVKFLNEKLERPAAKINVTRHFDLTFRVDANYVVYETLKKQRNVFFDPANSKTDTSIPEAATETVGLFTTDVKVLNEIGDVSQENAFRFSNCWISAIEPTAFSAESSKPVEVKVTINFTDFNDFGYEDIEDGN